MSVGYVMDLDLFTNVDVLVFLKETATVTETFWMGVEFVEEIIPLVQVVQIQSHVIIMALQSMMALANTVLANLRLETIVLSLSLHLLFRLV